LGPWCPHDRAPIGGLNGTPKSDTDGIRSKTAIASIGGVVWICFAARSGIARCCLLRRQFTADADIVHDVKHGLRMLHKSPIFTVSAVSILALGVGGTVAIVTLLDTLLFRPCRMPMPIVLTV
jgi:hypothetical protein